MPDFSTFVDLLQYRSQTQPDRIAFSFLQDGETETAQWTYGDLDRKARTIAAHLQERKLQGERALLLYAPNLDFIAGFFGCLYANVIAVPAYPPRSAQMLTRLTSIIEDAQAAIALSSSGIIENVTQRLGSDEIGKTIDCLATDQFNEQDAGDWQRPDLSPEQLAFLQYTSGSTGSPKGVIVSHGNLIHNSQQINHAFEDTPETIGVSWLPPYHDMGLVGGILQPIFVGLKMVLMPPVTFLQRPMRWLSAISKYGGTTSGGPNFAYDLCAKQIRPEQLEQLDLSSWTLAFSGAEPVRAETIETFSQTFAPCGFQKRAFFPCYGMAETTLIVTGVQKSHPPIAKSYVDQALAQNQAIESSGDDDTARVLVSSGQAIADLKLAIVEPETHVALPERKIGEIWVSSDSVTQGYWNKPELTEASFHAVPKAEDGTPISTAHYLRTGDLGFIDQGELFVAGRLKDLIIIRGQNHYPQDIELSVQEAHPALRIGCVAAFSLEEAGQEKLVIVQEVERTWLRKLNVEEVTQAIRQAVIANHQLQPDAILLLRTGGIPKTSSGKIQRYACRQRYQDNSLKVVGDWKNTPVPTTVESAPVNRPAGLRSSSQSRRIQSWLVQQVATQTGIATEAINATEPLSLYGLDSLAAVRLTADLEDWLMVEFDLRDRPNLSPTLAYDYPTIQQLSQYVGAVITSNDDASLPLTVENILGAETDDIAVIGFGCRFPGADGPDAYWELLRTGKSGISNLANSEGTGDRTVETPPANHAGFLAHIDQFDAEFFGISPREAEQMDPQQRLLMEVAWESLEHAGIPVERLAGSQTGVFVGISSSDYAQLKPPESASVYAGTGNAHSIAANRLSYFLDLQGPSMAVDTACSSSLVAIHLASQSLRHGDCDQAIAAGVNILLDAALTDTFTRSGMLSPDGQCKTFDKDADGYVRGEGCGVVILKRFSQAQQDGDRIWGVIRGSAINQDGRSNGLTAPNGRAQQAVIRQAIARARIGPHQISYVETHGTGTSLGDPIEVNALKQVLVQGRQDEPCWIGSVKTNFGHLEAAAGIAGVIKVLLALNHQTIPPHLNFTTLNPLIDLDKTSIQVPTALQSWNGNERYAGVSSFGFGGTNAHLVLASAPPVETPQSQIRPWHLLTLSAKTSSALATMERAYAQQLTQFSWPRLCGSTNAYRSALAEKTAVLAPADASLEQLQAALSGKREPHSLVQVLKAKQGTSHTLAFIFTGQGSQYLEMGRELFETSSQYRQAIETCDGLLRESLDGRSLIDLLYGKSASKPDIINQTTITQPVLFALEYALAQLWLSWGIEPDWVMGHSVGEYVAACIAGVFSLEDGLKLIAARAKLMDNIPQLGGMLVAFASASLLETYLADTDLVIAAYNGPENTVISGEQAAIAQLEATLHKAGIKTKGLEVSQAFHSPLMKPMITEFQAIAETITFHPPQRPIISNVTAESIEAEIATARYWCDHVLAPVRFAQSLATLDRQGVDVFLELGPKPTLLGMGRRCLPGGDRHWLPSLRPGRSDWAQMLESLAYLYLSGYEIAWQAVDRPYTGERVSLPTYPWERQRYWLEGLGKTTSLAPASPAPQKQPLYQTIWEPLELSPEREIHEGQWIFWGDRDSFTQFKAALPSSQSASLVEMAAEALDTASDWQKRLQSTSLGSPMLGILDARRLQRTTAPQSAADQEATWHLQAIALLQALQADNSDAKLWSLTPEVDTPVAACHASVLGLARGIALEQPKSLGGTIMIADWIVPWRRVLNEINMAVPEATVKLASQGRWVQRLVTHSSDRPSDPAPLCTSDGVYVITGGLGALGLASAQWLVNQGARHLMLIGRSQPSGPAKAMIQSLGDQDVQIRHLALDVCQPSSLGQLRQAIAQTSLPLKGIIHAAGILDDRLIVNLTAETFRKVFDVKVKGAWMLHELSLDHHLDFFLCYSSAASVFGSPGQAHYAAANAALDALATYRQEMALPGLSLNWGPWADGGMATTAIATRSLQAFGFEFLSASQNFECLADLLQAQTSGCVGVFQVDWQTLQAHPGTQPLHAFLSGLLPSQSESVQPAFTLGLQDLAPPERDEVILNYLRRTLAQLMQVPLETIAPSDHLMEMGADSLMVMDAIALIQQDLDLMVYPREIYEHPQLDALAHYLSLEYGRLHDQDMAVAAAEPSKPLTFEQFATPTPQRSPAQKKLKPAVFVLSSPRAGSTLLRVMLAGHSQLFSPPELHLLPFETMGDRLKNLEASHLGEGLQRALMALGNLSADESQARLEQWQRDNKPVAEVYEYLQQLAGDRRLVDKSPTYGMQSETLEQADALFEGAKFIHLVRHPYAMIDSFVSLRMEKLIGMAQANPYQVAEEIWTRSNQNILKLGQQVGDRYHQLSYESLVQNPQAELEKICEFLGLPFEPQMLNPYAGDRLTDGVYQQSMSVGDPNFKQHTAIDPALADRWKQVTLPTPLTAETSDLAATFTYDLPAQSSVTPRSEAHPPVEMREHVLTVRGLDLCLCEWGPKDGTPILCLHGILDQGLVWEPVAMALARAGYRVIAPDLRGHGKSDHVGPGGAYHLMDFLGDVVALAERIVDRPMYIIGHSLGSVVAGIFTRVRSQLVRHLILVEPVLPRNSQNEDLLENMNTFLEYTLTPPKHTVMKDLAMAVERLRKAIPSLSIPFAKRLAERGTKPHDNGLIWRWDAVLRARASLNQQGGPITRDSYLQLLSEIQVPLTAVYGNDSTFNRPEDLDEQRAAIPHANRVVLPGGHNLALDAPTELVRCILDSVSRLKPSGRGSDSRQATQ